MVLTFSGACDYNPVTDEGGGAAGDEVSRSKESHDRLAECWLGPSFGLVSGVFVTAVFSGIRRLLFDN